MADFDWPFDLGPGAGMSFYLQPSTRRHESPYTRQTQILGLAPPRWVAVLPITRGGIDAGRVDGLLALLRGGQRTVTLFDWRRPDGYGDTTSTAEYASTVPHTNFDDGSEFADDTDFYVASLETPSHSGAAAGATSIEVTGFAPHRTIRHAGDYIGVGDGRCYITTIDAISDSRGGATLSFEPPLRSAAPAGPLYFSQVRTTFRLVSDDAGQNPTDRPSRSKYNLQFSEDLS